MSGNRYKSTTAKPIETVEEPVAARVVAIPKDPELTAANAPNAVPPKITATTKAKTERIGDILRQARTERNDDLYQIAEYLCIKPAFLIALENSRYDEFHADAYVIGFLRTYANFLGVDGKDAVDRYRYEMAGRRKKPILLMPTPVSEGRAPTAILMVGATVVILLIYALWYGISSSNRAEVNVPPPLPTAAQPVPQAAVGANVAAGLTAPITPPSSASATTAPTSLTPSAIAIPPAAPGIVVTASQSPAAAKEEAAAKLAALQQDSEKPAVSATLRASDTKPADNKPADTSSNKDTGKQVYGDPAAVSRIIIRATQSSWVMVTDSSGKAVFDHVLKPGDVYKVPNKSGLSLTTGNGSGIVLSLDGSDLPKVANGAPHVVRNIALDPDRLTGEPSASDR